MGVIIPKVIARLVGIKAGQELRMDVTPPAPGKPGHIEIAPLPEKAKR